MAFDIRDHIEFDPKGRAPCPACEMEGKSKKNLSVSKTGAYKCFRGHSPQEIREALGSPKPKTQPAPTTATTKKATVTPRTVATNHKRLMENSKLALQWLRDRGCHDDIIKRHRLGVSQCYSVEGRKVWAITIPIPANPDRTAFLLKKRIAPWDKELSQHPEYSPWQQTGISSQVMFSHKPENASTTWLCEGEWDAFLLGYLLSGDNRFGIGEKTAVACFTSGAGNVPSAEQLDRLPGDVVTFYDLDKAGREGAKKVQSALGKRCKIASVPADDPSDGFDVSDAINEGACIPDFADAAKNGKPWVQEQEENPLRERMLWNDVLLDTAPDYVDWLVPDLLTQNELFLLAAGPRAGKSLLAMTLSRAVASGGMFLGRPCTQGTVFYISIEDGPAKLKEREKLQGWDRGLPVCWFPKFKLSELKHLGALAREQDDLRLIVLDTLSRIKDCGVNESSAEMSQLLEPLQDLANELDCCVLLVHHTGKVNIENANAVDIFDTIRGSSAIRAVCRGSMVIAAGDRDYRLVTENGWGKHDLKVVLDANSLNWKLLGRWNPVEDTGQKEQILDFLKQVQSASIDQISESTGIPKKSLYTQLSRLQASEDPNEKVIKEGKRRRYTYRLALFNTIQQLNSVLNSPKSDSEGNTGDIQQNIFVNPSPVDNQTIVENGVNNEPVLEKTDPCKTVELLNISTESKQGNGSAYSTAIQQEGVLLNSDQLVEKRIDVGDEVVILAKDQPTFYGKRAKVTHANPDVNQYHVIPIEFGDDWEATLVFLGKQLQLFRG